MTPISPATAIALPINLPALPEPYTVASTIKCTACGAPYSPPLTLAGEAAQWALGRIPPHSCRCGNTQFGGTVSSESLSPAQFTADQMNAHATAAVEADRASRAVQVPVEASEPDLNDILAIADEESKDSTENGDRLFTRDGVATFARRMFNRGLAATPSAPQAPQAEAREPDESSVPLTQSLQSWKDIEVVSRIRNNAGKTVKEVRNPSVTARDSIILANYIAEQEAVIHKLMAAPSTAATFVLDEDMAGLLRQTIGDDGDPNSIRLEVGDGHSGWGLYASLTEYPEEGAVQLVECAAPSSATAQVAPQATAVAMPDEVARLADKLKTWIDLNVGRAAEATILLGDVDRLAALALPPPPAGAGEAEVQP
jgi:hypothetical protein